MFKRRSLTPSFDNPLMASAHHNSQSGFSHLPPHQMQSEFKLPSLKDLNFQYHSVAPGSSQDAPALSSAPSTSSDHGSQGYPSSRRDWSRPPSATTPINPSSSHSQLSPQIPIHEQQSQQHPPQKQVPYSNYNHDPAYFPSPMAPPSHTSSASQDPRDDSPNPNKRPRSTPNTITNSSAHPPHPTYPSSHAPYPPSQPTGPSFHQHPHPAPPPHDQVHHPPLYHGGYPYLSPYGQQRQPPHMPPPHAHHQMAPIGYPQPPPHWQPIPPPLQHPPQHPYPGHPSQFSGGYRTTPVVTTNLDARVAYPPQPPTSEVIAKSNVRQNIISEIANNCRILYEFASRCAQMQRNVQPRKDELVEMAQRAANIVRLLEDLRRVVLPDHAPSSADKNGLGNGHVVNGDDYRPPKRPWEEISKEAGESLQSPVERSVSKRSTNSDKSSPGQSLAEKDMDLIRAKRASTTGSSTAGQQKSKYRKRSRASPPGKCHSCNIRETPEWRRGPDGARTLCNACGLHYAKLVRKRDKQPDGKPAPIDLETLRACTAQVRGSLPFPDSPMQEDTSQPAAGNGNGLGGAGYRVQDDSVDATVEGGTTSYSQNPTLKEEHAGNASPASHSTSQSLPSMMPSEDSLPSVPPSWVSRGSEGSFGSRRSPFSG